MCVMSLASYIFQNVGYVKFWRINAIFPHSAKFSTIKILHYMVSGKEDCCKETIIINDDVFVGNIYLVLTTDLLAC